MSDSTGLSRVVFRPMASVILGGLVVLFAAYLLADTVRRGEGPGAWALGAGLVLGGLVVWVSSVRPAVVAGATALQVRNPLREHVIPWGAIDDMRLRFQLDVYVDDETYNAWAVPVSTRGRIRDQRRRLPRSDFESKMGRPAVHYAEQEQHATYAERTLSELTLIWNQRKVGARSDEPVKTRWAWPYIAAMAAAAGTLVVALFSR